MAIQSASALSAYLTSAISTPVSPDTDAQAASVEGRSPQGGAAGALAEDRRVVGGAPASTAEELEKQADDTRAPEPATYAAYGSNARSVAVRAVAGNISFYA